MRAEHEIRRALRRLGGPENEKPRVIDEGVLIPMNSIAADVLHWVMGERSDFGDALVLMDRSEAVDHARRN